MGLDDVPCVVERAEQTGSFQRQILFGGCIVQMNHQVVSPAAVVKEGRGYLLAEVTSAEDQDPAPPARPGLPGQPIVDPQDRSVAEKEAEVEE
jgi:hypothetical protein